jgi:peptidoglycan/xylan/chitin deacetylase (PgdA/CDA1 family)
LPEHIGNEFIGCSVSRNKYNNMFSTDQLKGLSLPEKTLCLTFDDGPGETEGDDPGPKTVQLAEYLTEQNISATFFMVGSHL